MEKKEKWVLVYGCQVFSADLTNTLRNENLHSAMNEFSTPEIDLLSFLRQYEKLLEEQRYAERQADYLAIQGTNRIPPLWMLWQAANAYTPAIFEMFRLEFELFRNCVLYSCCEVGTVAKYEVNTEEKTKAHFVTFDLLNGTVLCSCKRFEFVGVQRCHALKVLDLRNIKELPPHYILKRWRKDAKAHFITHNHNFVLDGNHKSSLAGCCRSLCRILYQIAVKAAENAETYAFMESQSDQLLEQVESILYTKLLEKTASTTASKGQPQNLVQNGSNNGGSHGLSGKRKKNVDPHPSHLNVLDSNRRHKGSRGASDEAEVPVGIDEGPLSTDVTSNGRNPPQFFVPTQFIQGSFVSAHQFGLNGVQGFCGIAQFNQESSVTTLQQPFHNSSQLSQVLFTSQFNGEELQLGNMKSYASWD